MPFLPRIISTTLSSRMSRTSTNSFWPWATARDPVAHLQSSIHLRRAAGNKVFDFCVAILRAKHGADAHERKAHVNAEILQVGLAQVFRVRIVGLRERVEENLHLLVLDPARGHCGRADHNGVQPVAPAARSDVRSVVPAISRLRSGRARVDRLRPHLSAREIFDG